MVCVRVCVFVRRPGVLVERHVPTAQTDPNCRHTGSTRSQEEQCVQGG